MPLSARPSQYTLTLLCVACTGLVAAHSVNATLEAWLQPPPAIEEEVPPVPPTPRRDLSTPLALAPLARYLGLPDKVRQKVIPAPDTGPMPNTLGLKLLGTMLGTPASASFASVYEGPAHRTRSVWMGSELQGARVVSIERTKILVLNAGRMESIHLDGDTASRSAPPPASPPPATQEGIQQVGANAYEISRQRVDASLTNFEDVAMQARIVPSFRNGEPQGFKLFSVRPGSIYTQLGLRNGDVLRSINGLSLSSPDRALEAYSRLRDTSHLDLEMEREGQVMHQTYTVR